MAYDVQQHAPRDNNDLRGGFTNQAFQRYWLLYCHEPALIGPLTNTVMIPFFTAKTGMQFVDWL